MEVRQLDFCINYKTETGGVAMIPLLIIAGASGSGKTTLIEKLIKELVSRGYRIGIIKHTSHDHFEVDTPGKDTWKFNQAGAEITCIASPVRMATMKKISLDKRPEELLENFSGMDLVIAEGYKNLKNPVFPVIEVIQVNQLERYVGSPLALVGSKPVEEDVPYFDRDDTKNISYLIEDKILKRRGRSNA